MNEKGPGGVWAPSSGEAWICNRVPYLHQLLPDPN